MNFLRLKSLSVVVALLSTLVTGVNSPPIGFAKEKELKCALQTLPDALKIQSYAGDIPERAYPDFSVYKSTLSSFSPCQWDSTKYKALREDVNYHFNYAYNALLAGENARDSKVRRHYQFIAKREIFTVLASVMADWAALTEPTAANDLLKEFWLRSISPGDVRAIERQVRWHYVYMGELEAHIAKVYNTIDTISFIKGSSSTLYKHKKAYEYGVKEFHLEFLKDVAARLGIKHLAWVDSYTKILAESEKIMIPMFYKTQRSAVQNSWTALIGSL